MQKIIQAAIAQPLIQANQSDCQQYTWENSAEIHLKYYRNLLEECQILQITTMHGLPPPKSGILRRQITLISTCAEIFTDWVTVFERFQLLFSVINLAYLLNTLALLDSIKALLIFDVPFINNALALLDSIKALLIFDVPFINNA